MKYQTHTLTMSAVSLDGQWTIEGVRTNMISATDERIYLLPKAKKLFPFGGMTSYITVLGDKYMGRSKMRFISDPLSRIKYNTPTRSSFVLNDTDSMYTMNRKVYNAGPAVDGSGGCSDCFYQCEDAMTMTVPERKEFEERLIAGRGGGGLGHHHF